MTTAVVGGWQVVIMAKSPRAGAVKTRLCPPLTFGQAAELAAASLADTLAAALDSGAQRCVISLDGPVGPWLEPGFDVVRQRNGDFGTRLAGAVVDVWLECQLPMLVVGMDTPQLAPTLLDRAAGKLMTGGCDAVLGPAEDGGFWVIGTRRPVDGMF